MSITRIKALGTAILALVIILAGCNPDVSNVKMRRGYKADGEVGSGGPPVTNQTLTAPTGVSTAVLSTERILVSWNAVTGATSYRVYYGEPNSSTMKYYVIVTAPATSWEDNDVLDKGNNYYYQVQAVNDTGQGPLSSVTQQEYKSTPTTTPASNPFIGTWYNTHDSSDKFIFSDHSVTHYYDGGSGSGSYTYSGNQATLTLSYNGSPPNTYIADITGPNSLRMSFESGSYHDFTKQ